MKKVSSKKSKQAKEPQSSKLTKKTDVDTFDAWVDHQKDHTLEKGTFRSITEGKMPPNTTQKWLARQKVSEEAPELVEMTLPASTTETWLRKQVSDRMSSDEKTVTPEATPRTQDEENSIQTLPA